jgi:flavin-dependent dehydrogenase
VSNLAESYDVVIIGAGPGGLSCAKHLAGSTKKVLVLEKSAGLGEKICSGLISPKAFPDMAGHSADRGIPWTEISVATRNSKKAVKFARPYLWTMGRKDIEGRLLRDCTADVHFSEPVRRITRDFVESDKGRYTYKHLVGADGSLSKVRKYLGLPSKHIVGWAFHYILDRPCAEFQMHWVPREFKGAYGYMMPKNKQQTMAGLAWAGESFDAEVAARAKTWIAATFHIDPDKTPHEAMKGNADYRGWRFGNTYLVGDAGGFLNPVTTEGIWFAMRSGEGVAKFILGDSEGERILAKMVAAHRKQVRIFDLMTNRKLPLCWFIEWLFRNPERGLRRRIFGGVFWNLMEG